MVTELLVLGFIFFVLVGSVSFYFYSRMLYTERKINLLETILLDIKMTMEMEENRQHDEFMENMHNAPSPVIIKDLSGTPLDSKNDSEELATQADFYNTVLENAPTALLSESRVDMAEQATTATPDYEAMAREELVSLAEKRGLRLTKRISKQAVLALLREADKNSSSKLETDKDATSVTGNMDGSGEGAPLDAVESETLPLA